MKEVWMVNILNERSLSKRSSASNWEMKEVWMVNILKVNCENDCPN